MRAHRRSSGFTLIEVLVALSIVAIALMAGMQATNALTNTASRQSDLLLAHLCAENELTRIRLLKQMPVVGNSDSRCEQVGITFDVAVTVVPTPNPNFRRVDARVTNDEVPVLKLSTVIGRF
ncbi:MAG TPA: type II secretion system minor pseudopilin GspI [Burkholderiaceae bacterium]|nr:type II secretion system minor pseudopilin GspI [Burkholderiaceae bacterium]HPW07066.1 type II secretion system minor pseudopilin GspI [Burkholderiaceae bacterium]